MDIQKVWGWSIGLLLLVFGVLGFIQDPVLGLFKPIWLLSIFHIITSTLFLWAAWKGDWARPINKWVGIGYIIVAIIGFSGLIADNSINWIYTATGFITASIGWLFK